ncbi:MAG: DNA repair protein RecO C-terminal domain-containing protein, partial [Chitinophagaceae bacterium]
VRTYTKKGPGKASLFQPASILDVVVYHNDLKNLQRLRDYKWGYLYRHVFSDVRKNTVALFMVELLQKTIRQPEPNDDLYSFIEDALMHLDTAGEVVTGNFPLFFSLHLASFFGFQIRDNFSASRNILDLLNGSFVDHIPDHPHFIDGELSETASHLLKILHPHELENIRLTQKTKGLLLEAVLAFYSLQIPEFGTMRTIPVLREILS